MNTLLTLDLGIGNSSLNLGWALSCLHNEFSTADKIVNSYQLGEFFDVRKNRCEFFTDKDIVNSSQFNIVNTALLK